MKTLKSLITTGILAGSLTLYCQTEDSSASVTNSTVKLNGEKEENLVTLSEFKGRPKVYREDSLSVYELFNSVGINTKELYQKENKGKIRIEENGIVYLDASKIILDTLYSSIGSFKILKELHLEDNEFENLPKEIGNLKNLKVLYLDKNKLKDLPKEIGALENLEELYLEGNKLKTLPKEIGNLKNLKALYLDKNKLKTLPKEIGNLKNIEILYLDNNELENLPKEIGNLKNLKTLYLRNNKLNFLPRELKTLKNLEELSLWNNQLDQESKNLLEKLKQEGVDVIY